MPAPDTKLRNFCFAYHGEALKTSILESLHATSAEGVFIEQDGNWYAKISLDRSHGRRLANIPNIITEYNSKIGSSGCKIDVITLPSLPTPVICFKNTGPEAENLITRRIRSGGQGNATFWEWDLKKKRKERTVPTKAPQQHTKHKNKATPPSAKTTPTNITTGLEGLVRELNLDPSTLDMQGAYTAVSRNYKLIKDTELCVSGQISPEDKTLLLKQLARYFHKEMAYTSKPFEATKGLRRPGQTDKTAAALAAANGGSVSDFSFIMEGDDATGNMLRAITSDPNPHVPPEPNDTICECFRRLISIWMQHPRTMETAEIATNDIVCILNGGSMNGGAYRSTSIRGAVRPFMLDNLIKVKDSTENPPRYIVDVRGMAAKLDARTRT
jgi:hypothetical protein